MVWSLMGDQAPLGERPTWQTFAGEDQILQADEYQNYQAALSDWEYIKGQRKIRQDIYQKMAQKEGPLLPGGKYGQDLSAVPSLSMIGGMAPVNEKALYGQPQPFPGIYSIVNPRRKREEV